MSSEPIIATRLPAGETGAGVTVDGSSFSVHEWGGAGAGEVAPLHVHYSDDEAWHVLEGTLRFRFAGERVELVPAGGTVFVPAGVAHTFGSPGGHVRFLLIMSPNLARLVAKLHGTDRASHREVFREFDSEIVG